MRRIRRIAIVVGILVTAVFVFFTIAYVLSPVRYPEDFLLGLFFGYYEVIEDTYVSENEARLSDIIVEVQVNANYDPNQPWRLKKRFPRVEVQEKRGPHSIILWIKDPSESARRFYIHSANIIDSKGRSTPLRFVLGRNWVDFKPTTVRGVKWIGHTYIKPYIDLLPLGDELTLEVGMSVEWPESVERKTLLFKLHHEIKKRAGARFPMI